MKINLFEHNKQAYEATVVMLKKYSKAAIIHPTGTGKSLIAFKLALDNPDAKVLWLAPSSYIYHTQLENLKRQAGTAEDTENVLSNITFISYSKLMHNEEMIEDDKLHPDYIILDEFHRCGAQMWGRSIAKLISANPQAKLLGLSATNIRYLDNQRDMAIELFDGCIASEMTLGEAIACGILAPPKYVTALYSYGQEIKRLEEKVKALRKNAASNDIRIKKSEALLEQLKRALEHADGPEQIFPKYMENKKGKYIVFCSGREHMREMTEKASSWFHRVDENPHIYTAYYSNPETSKAFADFKQDASEHLRLLYCIDMLNEGVHVDDIDGVILLRPTVSPIIYMQQIGRTLQTGANSQPLVFDLVNNFESLECIDFLKKEVDEAFAIELGEYEKKEKFKDHFQIIDEVKDCRLLFDQLNESLTYTWEDNYEVAKKYYQENGNLKVPKSYVTVDGMALGSWIQTQRKVRQHTIAGQLSPERIRKLDEIGMIWNIRNSNFEEAYAQLKGYYEEHGDVDVKSRYVTPDGYALGKWINNLRMAVKKKGIDAVLDKSQQDRLAELGMIWDKNSQIWNTYIEAAREYKEQNGNLHVPVKYVTSDGVALGNWIASLKNGMNGSKQRSETLTSDQKAQLNELGIEWQNSNVTVWNTKFELAKDYYTMHGNLNIPVAYCVNGVRLGRWISNLRSKRKNPGSSGMMLDESRIRMLDSIGMNWK